ncbi:hypothetical protein GY45DRAFT_1328364 [Cubamyces sp. BRFM 1775]|nr:hypothetical protein GY45DRAFT_1328364 [Cubamyces sp. BRFM 1775]
MAIRSRSPPPPYDPQSEGAEGEITEDAPTKDSTGVKAGKALGIGLLALVAVPVALAGAAVVAAGGVVWGAAKVVEGVGKGLAAGPEAAARAFGQSTEVPPPTRERPSKAAEDHKSKGEREGRTDGTRRG